ncbi:MAG: sulfatase-like hydrolase/transferase [Gemmatimonadales bacterium]
MTRRLSVLYPFLAAAYPVLALAAANRGEGIRPAELVMPLAVSLAVAGALLLLARLITPDPHRRAILAFLGVIVFASHGYVRELLLSIPPLGFLAHDAVTLPLAGLLLGATAMSARAPGRSYAAVSRYLTVVMAILVGGSAVTFARGAPPPRVARPPHSSPPGAGDGTGTRPHFFLIVLDKYTGSASLASNYRFDNAGFERFLEEHGFRVLRGPRANYVQTFLALASLLNWEYADGLVDSLGGDEQRRELLYPMVEDNRTAQALAALGYRFVFVPSAFAITMENRFADERVQHPRDVPREFETVWLRTTLLHRAVERWCATARCFRGLLPQVHESAESFDWKFARLGELARSTEPLFVFAHLALPHEPYLFAADCSHTKPYWPERDDGPEAEQVKAAYVAQVQCVNRKLERLVQELDRTGGRPAIVVLQSDHGHGRLGRDLPALEDVTADRIAERVDIFAAYHLPGAPAGLIPDSMGPVNAMRAIMRHYYGFDLPPLEESTWWSSRDQPYKLTRIP